MFSGIVIVAMVRNCDNENWFWIFFNFPFKICCNICTLAAVITFKIWIRIHYDCPGDVSTGQDDCTESPNVLLCILLGTLLPACMNAFSVVVWEIIYTIVAQRVTKLGINKHILLPDIIPCTKMDIFIENHQTQSDFNDALIIKLFIFQFINSYGILFYIMLFRPQYNVSYIY